MAVSHDTFLRIDPIDFTHWPSVPAQPTNIQLFTLPGLFNTNARIEGEGALGRII
jgi:hypothetical protein